MVQEQTISKERSKIPLAKYFAFLPAHTNVRYNIYTRID